MIKVVGINRRYLTLAIYRSPLLLLSRSSQVDLGVDKMDEELQRALALLREGNRAEAMRIVSRILQSDPHHAEAWAALAQIVEEPERKVDCLRRVLSLSDDERLRNWAQAELAQIEEPASITPPPPALSEVARQRPAPGDPDREQVLPSWQPPSTQAEPEPPMQAGATPPDELPEGEAWDRVFQVWEASTSGKPPQREEPTTPTPPQDMFDLWGRPSQAPIQEPDEEEFPDLGEYDQLFEELGAPRLGELEREEEPTTVDELEQIFASWEEPTTPEEKAPIIEEGTTEAGQPIEFDEFDRMFAVLRTPPPEPGPTVTPVEAEEAEPLDTFEQMIAAVGKPGGVHEPPQMSDAFERGFHAFSKPGGDQEADWEEPAEETRATEPTARIEPTPPGVFRQGIGEETPLFLEALEIEPPIEEEPSPPPLTAESWAAAEEETPISISTTKLDRAAIPRREKEEPLESWTMAEHEEEQLRQPRIKQRRRGCLIVIAALVGVLVALVALALMARRSPQIAALFPFFAPSSAPTATPLGVKETVTQPMMPSPEESLPPTLTPTLVTTEMASPTPSPLASPTAPISPTAILPTPTAVEVGGTPSQPQPIGGLTVQSIPGNSPDFGRVVVVKPGLTLVGAPFEDAVSSDDKPISGAGVVYILLPEGESWTEGSTITPLIAPNPQAAQGFGAALALDGDRLVVGTRTGNSVTIFERDDEGWKHQTTLVGTGSFGRSVAIDENTIAIGAPEEAEGGIRNAGAVYIYGLNNGTWVRQARLVLPNPSENDRFGQAVALDGSSLAVGSLAGSGSVHIYHRAGTAWGLRTRLTVTNDGSFELFGWPLALADRVIAVGTQLQFFPELPGEAFIFEDVSQAGDWSRYIEFRLLAPRDLVGTYFGSAVATDGRTVVVGAVSMAPSGTTSAGRLCLYRRDGRVWALQSILGPPPEVPVIAHFGLSVGVDDNLVVVGAPLLEPDAEGAQGAITIFELPGP